MIAAPLTDDRYREILATPSESRHVMVDDGRVHYLVWQRPDGRRRPVLLFVHGMRGHAHWWDFIAPWFVQDYQVLAIDLSGMGDSTRRSNYDTAVFVRDIAAVAMQESRDPIIVVGHSFGGSRVLAACAARPELFSHAVIVDSTVLMRGDPLVSQRILSTGRVYPDRASILARFRLQPDQPVCSSVLRDHIAAHSIRQTDAGWVWKFDPLLNDGDTLIEPDSLARIRTPTDFIHGESSEVMTPERIARNTRAVPSTRAVVSIPGGHHHLMLDQPVALIATLRALLATA